MRLAGGEVVALFPCRPQRLSRSVTVAGALRRMELLTCDADGLTFALGRIGTGSADDAAALVTALQAALAANVGVGGSAAATAAAAGRAGGDATLRGHFPDGRTVVLRVRYFHGGGQLVQASVGGPALPDDVVQTFYAGLRVVAPADR